MDQDGTWYGGRPRPSDVVLDGDAAPPKRCTAPSFRPMSIVATVLDGDPAAPSPPIGAQQHSPSSRPTSIVATVAHLSYCMLGSCIRQQPIDMINNTECEAIIVGDLCRPTVFLLFKIAIAANRALYLTVPCYSVPVFCPLLQEHVMMLF